MHSRLRISGAGCHKVPEHASGARRKLARLVGRKGGGREKGKKRKKRRRKEKRGERDFVSVVTTKKNVKKRFLG